MTLGVTLALMAAFVAAAVFCGWRGARPPDFRRGPRMMPWRLLMVACATAAIILLVHAANLAGVQTGRP